MENRKIISPKPSTDIELCPSGTKKAKISNSGGFVLGSNVSDLFNVKLHVGPGGSLQVVRGDDTTLEGLDSPNKIIISSSSLSVSGITSITTSATATSTVNLPEVGSNANFVLDQGNQTINGSKTFTSPILASSSVPIGALLPFAGTSAPTGYLFCNGGPISRTTYAALFAVIGESYGIGDGATTFNLPDTQAAFLRGAGTSTKFTQNKVVASSGVYESDALQGHTHLEGYSGGPESSRYGTVPGQTSVKLSYYTSEASNTLGIKVSNPYDDGTHGTPRTSNETRPNNVSVNYIIRAI